MMVKKILATMKKALLPKREDSRASSQSTGRAPRVARQFYHRSSTYALIRGTLLAA